MGIPVASCKCLKTCRDFNEEVDLAKGDYLRSKTGNFKINNESRNLSPYKQTKNISINTITGNTEIINNEIKKDDENQIKETLQNQIIGENEENNFIKSNNNAKTVIIINTNIKKDGIDINNSTIKEEQNEDKNDNSNSENNNYIKNNNEKSNSNHSKLNNSSSIIIINNFDKEIFLTEKLKKAEKNFEHPINYEKDWNQYCEDTDNEDMLILINEIKSNKGNNHTKEEGQVIEFKGEKYLYIGELDKKGNPTGLGVLYTINGEKYEGTFNKGKLIGLGRYIDKEGTCYEGIFNNNKIVSNKAKIIKYNENKKKITYFGEIINYKKSGKGVEICDDYKYSGEFLGDLRHGHGHLELLKDGDFYKGEFNRGEITGKGLYIWNNKQKYEGDFLKGIKHGKGIYKWPDGTEYEGDYINGIREGSGLYKWKDGRIFKGKFKNGRPDGKGKLCYNGKTIDCDYQNGKPNIDIKKFLRREKSKEI